MFDLMDFIDSPDIREHNRNTEFAPDEQAVLVARSNKRTVEEKISALEYLQKTYPEEAFKAGNVVSMSGEIGEGFAAALSETIRIWKKTLQDRFESKGHVFAIRLKEKEMHDGGRDYERYFSTWQTALDALTEEKQQYLDDEDLRQEPTYGIIGRFRLDVSDGEENRYSFEDVYYFDNEMRLTWISPANSPKSVECLLDEYTLFCSSSV